MVNKFDVHGRFWKIKAGWPETTSEDQDDWSFSDEASVGPFTISRPSV